MRQARGEECIDVAVPGEVRRHLGSFEGPFKDLRTPLQWFYRTTLVPGLVSMTDGRCRNIGVWLSRGTLRRSF